MQQCVIKSFNIFNDNNWIKGWIQNLDLILTQDALNLNFIVKGPSNLNGTCHTSLSI